MGKRRCICGHNTTESSPLNSNYPRPQRVKHLSSPDNSIGHQVAFPLATRVVKALVLWKNPVGHQNKLGLTVKLKGEKGGAELWGSFRAWTELSLPGAASICWGGGAAMGSSDFSTAFSQSKKTPTLRKKEEETVALILLAAERTAKTGRSPSWEEAWLFGKAALRETNSHPHDYSLSGLFCCLL